MNNFCPTPLWPCYLLSLLTACTQTNQPEISENLPETDPQVAVLLVDTDRIMGMVEEDIYGHFLEHINHSVVDGLYAEQIRGQGFEANDFETYWESFSENGSVELADVIFEGGEKSLQLSLDNGQAGIRQQRVYVQEKMEYSGSVWVKPQEGSVNLLVKLLDSNKDLIAESPLATSGREWQEIPFSFTSSKTSEQATIEISAEGTGSLLLDFISMMPAEYRGSGMLRPDLLESLRDLAPPFIRWPGGSFASIYYWKDGIGPQVSRKYHPNAIWGNYSDYYGFGTDEFLEMCHQLGSEPMIVLKATSTDPEEIQYAMDWVHYVNDPQSTEWGQMRAANGHPEPYNIKYFQIDNEPMNHGLTPDQYAEIVNAYGSRLREEAPDAQIVACGQKRSYDMIWSEKVIDIAGENFDILGCHNYEYEPDNYETGVKRIEDYLVKLRDYARESDHPDIKFAGLEWGLSRSYDWRAGLHAAGSLISYEKLNLAMSCPALLMRNTEDDPTWSAFIYHDHVSWFPGAGYVTQKLFREHYAPLHFASTTGTMRDREDRFAFFDDISQHKQLDWNPGTVDAIATGTEDRQRIVLKAVNYTENKSTLITRIQGSSIPKDPAVSVFTIQSVLADSASLAQPDKIAPVQSTIPFSRDLAIELGPYSVVVVEIKGE